MVSISAAYDGIINCIGRFCVALFLKRNARKEMDDISKVNHLRDEIRRMLITYALIPIFIISIISVALFSSYWSKNVIDRNRESGVLVGEALAAIISLYMEKEMELAGRVDPAALARDKAARVRMYQELYAEVNITHAGAKFYLLDRELNLLVSNANKKPDFLVLPKDTAWGIIRQIHQRPLEASMAFIHDEREPWFSSCDLAIGKAIAAGGEIRGYIIFVLPGAYLANTISNPYVQFAVTDRFGNMLAATDDAFSNLAVHKLKAEFQDADGYFSYEKQRYYVTRSDVLDGALYVYAITPIDSIVGQYGMAVAILFGVLIVLTVTIVVSVKRRTAEKTKVIDQLVEAFAVARQGRLDTPLQIKTNNEFEIIAEAYNSMIGSLKHLMRLNHERARETVISEIKQLESQFNPHFLFNTLENIRFMIKLDQTAAAKMIVALSALLRYSIDAKLGEVTVEEDLFYTQNYLDIQRYRFGERLTYQFNIAKEARTCVVPKLIIQPIIENAVKYGGADASRMRIEIELWVEDGQLFAVIFNNGTGMEASVLEEIRGVLAANENATRHTGLYNVNRRIKLMYGTGYGVEIASEKQVGTMVKLVLPARRAKGSDCHAEGFDRGR